MAAPSDFALFAADLLAPIGPVVLKRMFGGTGFYLGGVMFAIVIADTLYLCADDELRAAFTAEGTGPFTYTAKGREIAVRRFHEVPGRLLDDGDELTEWARRALKAAAIPAAKARPRAKKPLKPKKLSAPGR